jgi:hypothetical protein
VSWTTEPHNTARVWKPHPHGGTKTGKDAITARQRDTHPRAFGGVPAVRDGGLEHAVARSERPELEAMHDPAGDANEHDDADLHPDRDAAATPWLRREQHERRMIAGERAPRCGGRDGDHRLLARSEKKPPRPQAEPPAGLLARGGNRGLAARVEGEAGRPGNHHSGRTPDVRNRDRAGRSPRQPETHRRDRERRRRNACGRGDHRPITVKVSVAV